MNSKQEEGKLSAVEKASYGILAIGRNLCGQMIALFLMFFYTDVFGIPVRYIAAMFLIFSIWEGCSKQAAGFFMGKTQSQYGKYRPYILWTIVPYVVFSTLIFIAPELSVTNKILYAYITYFIWAVINNTLSTAHNSLLPMMSNDPSERMQMNSLKIILSVFSTIIVSSFTLKAVEVIGKGDQPQGFALTMLGMSLITVLIQLFAFKNIRERYYIVSDNKMSLKTAIHSISDKRLILFFLVYCVFGIANTFKNQSTTYYIKYVLEKPEFIGTFFMIGTISSFIMHFFIKRIVHYMKAETAMCIGFAGSILGVLIMYAADKNQLQLSAGNIVYGLMSAIPANLVYIVLAGYVDEKNNKYQTNLSSWLYSSMDNLAKIGTGIGGAALSSLLYRFGYEPNLQQTSTALFGIRLGFFGGTAAAVLICLILMVFYIRVCSRP